MAKEPLPGHELPHPPKMPLDDYERELRNLQIELVKAQYWVKDKGERILLIFEGRDTAGKGGTIARFKEHVNPRGAPHVALSAPTEIERTQLYLQRYIEHLPSGGEIVFFDRSWYNRLGVEPVMGFCTMEQSLKFGRELPEFERTLVDDGIRLFKLYLAVNRKEQKKRLKARRTDPLKTWKLSPIDHKAPKLWDAYTEAQNRMFRMTDTTEAPWAVVNSNDKRTARIHAIRYVLNRLPYAGKDEDVAKPPDPAIVAGPYQHWPELAR